jgi:beta-fructofuranosidase
VDGSLLRWRYCGPLVREPRRERRFLECPNFVQLPPSAPGGQPKWVLLTSPYNLVEYTTGEFNAAALHFAPEQHGILDAGHGEMAGHGPVPNYYATNIVETPDGVPVLLGWVRGFAAGRGWNGALALPRLVTVDADGRPRQQPLPALQALRGAAQHAAAIAVPAGSQVLPGLAGDALELQLALQLGGAAAAGVRLCSADDGQGGVEIRWDGAALTVAGVPVELPAGPERSLDLHIFLDKSILEVFADGGRVAMTRVVYPAAGDQAVAVFAEEGAAHIARLDAWQMQGIW